MIHASLTLNGVHTADVAIEIRMHAWQCPWLTACMLALTVLGRIATFCCALGAALAWRWWQKERRGAVLLAVALGGAFFLNEILKLLFHRARPAVAWAIGDEHTYSFPSGHAFFSVVLYGGLLALAWPGAHSLGRRVALVLPAALLPLAIGLSRIYLGAHYPTDVLAGWLCGLVWLAAVLRARQLYRLRTQPVLPRT